MGGAFRSSKALFIWTGVGGSFALRPTENKGRGSDLL